GEAFNSIVLDETTNRPFNPLVNAGAIASVSLVKATSEEDRWSQILGQPECLCWTAVVGAGEGVRVGVHDGLRQPCHRQSALQLASLPY
ncbi:MAG: glutaminase, partial [Nitrospira sp.]|nr:glutaminase [Nitrospira sp.]